MVFEQLISFSILAFQITLIMAIPSFKLDNKCEFSVQCVYFYTYHLNSGMSSKKNIILVFFKIPYGQRYISAFYIMWWRNMLVQAVAVSVFPL